MLIIYVSYIHYAPTHIKQNYGHQQIRALQKHLEQSKEFLQHIPVFTLLL